MTDDPTATQILKTIMLAERMQSYWSAVQIRALSTFAEYRPPDRPGVKLADGASEEIAAALGLSVAAATNRLVEAQQMVRRLPATVTALAEGTVDMSRARATVQVTKPLSNEDATKVEEAVLSHGRHASCKEYRRALRRQAMKADPEAAEQKRKQKLEDRDVVIHKTDDGAMKLVAKLPAHEAQATYHTLEHLAHEAKTADDTRTLAQRKADVLRDLLLGKNMERVNVNVNVTVPLTTLIGLNRQPGELSEYGPITAEQCRELAANATFRRLVTDDFGHLLDVGRDSYAAAPGFGDLIRTRDQTCRQPGCAVPARKCDIVHVGRCKSGAVTCDRDCGLLCKRHRLMHTRTNGWLTVQPVPGHFVFVTPSGCVRQVPVERFEEPAA